jgi:uncharacterized protein (TIGR02246 family)
MTQTDSNEAAFRGLIDTFLAGWNAADATKLASVFTADADFTAITGLHARGRDLIARGHSEILSTIYRGTKNSAEIESIHYLRPDVALLDVKFILRREDGSMAFGIPFTSAGVVATKDNGVWGIAVFRNMVPFARPVAGPVEREVDSAKTA